MFAYRKRILFTSVLIIFGALIYISSLQYQFWNSNDVTRVMSSNEAFTAELERLGVNFAGGYLDPLFHGLNSFIKFIIPGYSGGTYLLFFLLTRLWGEYIISLISALLFLWAMLALNHKYDKQFFYDEEPYFGAVAIFLTGWPGWLYYLIILLTLFLVFNFFGTILIRKRNIISEETQAINGSRVNITVAAIPEYAADQNARFSLYYFWIPIAIAIILLMFYLQRDLPYYNLLII